MPKLYNTTLQLALFFIGFLVSILLLESRGLIVWAERLDVGVRQQNLVKLAVHLDDHLSKLGISSVRANLLDQLNKSGWNDLERSPSGFLDELNIQYDAKNSLGNLPLFNNAGKLVKQPTLEQTKEVEEANPALALQPVLPIVLEQTNIKPIATATNTAPAALVSIDAMPEISVSRAQNEFVQKNEMISNKYVDQINAEIKEDKEAFEVVITNKGTAATVKSRDIFTAFPIATKGAPRVTALVGDSMMGVGLSAELLRKTAQFSSLKMIKAFRSGTGLSRPEVFNWFVEYPKMIGEYKPSVVILSMGANDAQGFVVDRKVLVFGSEQWKYEYANRVRAFLELLLQNDTNVLMMSLPVMRSKKFNSKIKLINEINYMVAQEYIKKNANIIWWDSHRYFEDDKGEFVEFKTIPNTQKMLHIRSVDGIHLSDQGASLIVPIIIKWLNPQEASADLIEK